MKGLIETKTKVLGPIAQEKLSGYAITCLGGRLQNGNVNFYPIIGGEISFDLDDLTGQVHIFRMPLINNSKELGDHLADLRKMRTEMRDAISKKIVSYGFTDDKLTKEIKIKRRQSFFNWLSSEGLDKVVKRVYDAGRAKSFAAYEEVFYVASFVEDDNPIPAQFVTVEGTEWGVDRPGDSLKGINSIRLNKAMWMTWRRSLGYKYKESMLEWLRLYHVYGGQEKDINVIQSIQYILDEPSQRMALTTVPEIADFIADQYINLMMFNLTTAGLNPENWYTIKTYNFILYDVSDQQLKNHIQLKTNEWQLTQVILPDSTPKMNIKVLPIWDGSTYSHDGTKLKEPVLYFRKINFSAETVTFDYKLKDSKKRRFKLVELLTINATADGEIRGNHVVYNRSQNKILSSLPGDTKISQIAVDVLFPWILGEEEPEAEHVSFERRHWPLVFAYSKFDAPPVSSDNFAEAMILGLQTFIGPNYYLCIPLDFVASSAEQFTTSRDNAFTIDETIFASFE
jgi:hypothetical protein